MADVFLSYAREDLGRATAVADACEKAGLTVWWDRDLGGGSEYSKEIERALKSAAAVVVLWSRSSVDSAWVRDEAAKGRETGRLIPATIDGTSHRLALANSIRLIFNAARGATVAASRRWSPRYKPRLAVNRQHPLRSTAMRAATTGR